MSVAATVEMRNGKIMAAPATTHHTDWQAQYLSALPSAQQLATADPDGDGRTNLLPVRDRARSAHARSERASLGLPRHRCGRGEIPRAALPADAECRRQPSHWKSPAISLNWRPANVTTRAVTLASDGSEIVDVVDTGQVSSSAARVFRLQATLTPP